MVFVIDNEIMLTIELDTKSTIVMARASHTVESILSQIAEKTKKPKETLRAFYKSKAVNENSKLMDHHIRNRDFLKVTSSVKVVVKTDNNKAHELEFSSYETNASVMNNVCKKTQNPPTLANTDHHILRTNTNILMN